VTRDGFVQSCYERIPPRTGDNKIALIRQYLFCFLVSAGNNKLCHVLPLHSGTSFDHGVLFLRCSEIEPTFLRCRTWTHLPLREYIVQTPDCLARLILQYELKANIDGLRTKGREFKSLRTGHPNSMLVEQLGPVDAFAFEDDQGDAFGGSDVVERVAVDHEEIGGVAGTNGADSVVGLQEAGGI